MNLLLGLLLAGSALLLLWIVYVHEYNRMIRRHNELREPLRQRHEAERKELEKAKEVWEKREAEHNGSVEQI